MVSNSIHLASKVDNVAGHSRAPANPSIILSMYAATKNPVVSFRKTRNPNEFEATLNKTTPRMKMFLSLNILTNLPTKGDAIISARFTTPNTGSNSLGLAPFFLASMGKNGSCMLTKNPQIMLRVIIIQIIQITR